MNTSENRIWIAFANERLCDHVGALRNLGYCDWACNAKLEPGDTVYLYVCNLPEEPRRLRYETVVESTGNRRTDTRYWKTIVSSKETAKLRLVSEHNGIGLYEKDLKNNGFIDFNAGSIKLLKEPLLSYVRKTF